MVLFNPAFVVFLTTTGDGERAVGNILRDDGARGNKRMRAHVHGGHHHGVAADEGAVADGGRPLLGAIVVAGDRACADVHALAERRVADVA